jgi:hypothetical protein
MTSLFRFTLLCHALFAAGLFACSGESRGPGASGGASSDGADSAPPERRCDGGQPFEVNCCGNRLTVCPGEFAAGSIDYCGDLARACADAAPDGGAG